MVENVTDTLFTPSVLLRLVSVVSDTVSSGIHHNAYTVPTQFTFELVGRLLWGASVPGFVRLSVVGPGLLYLILSALFA